MPVISWDDAKDDAPALPTVTESGAGDARASGPGEPPMA